MIHDERSFVYWIEEQLSNINAITFHYAEGAPGEDEANLKSKSTIKIVIPWFSL